MKLLLLCVFLLACQSPPKTSLDNKRALGAYLDVRSHEEIVADIEKKGEPVTDSVFEWLSKGPENVDLYGWDDESALQKIASTNADYALAIAHLQERFSDLADVRFCPATISKSLDGEFGALFFITDDLESIDTLHELLKSEVSIVKSRVFLETPSETGERGIFLTIQEKEQLMTFILQTERQALWSQWTQYSHTVANALDSQLSEGEKKVLERYAKDLSDAYFLLDGDKKAVIPEPPLYLHLSKDALPLSLHDAVDERGFIRHR